VCLLWPMLCSHLCSRQRHRQSRCRKILLAVPLPCHHRRKLVVMNPSSHHWKRCLTWSKTGIVIRSTQQVLARKQVRHVVVQRLMFRQQQLQPLVKASPKAQPKTLLLLLLLLLLLSSQSTTQQATIATTAAATAVIVKVAAAAACCHRQGERQGDWRGDWQGDWQGQGQGQGQGQSKGRSRALGCMSGDVGLFEMPWEPFWMHSVPWPCLWREALAALILLCVFEYLRGESQFDGRQHAVWEHRCRCSISFWPLVC